MEEINIKLTNQQIRLLQDYRDKSYVMNVLMTKSYERYAFIKQITNIPLIVSSSAMAIINSSSFKGDEIKLPNIIKWLNKRDNLEKVGTNNAFYQIRANLAQLAQGLLV